MISVILLYCQHCNGLPVYANSLLLTVRNQTPDHTQKLIANCDNFDCDRVILVAQESRLHNMCVACPREVNVYHVPPGVFGNASHNERLLSDIKLERNPNTFAVHQAY